MRCWCGASSIFFFTDLLAASASGVLALNYISAGLVDAQLAGAELGRIMSAYCTHMLIAWKYKAVAVSFKAEVWAKNDVDQHDPILPAFTLFSGVFPNSMGLAAGVRQAVYNS